MTNEFVIPRDRWLRGEGDGGDVYLLRPADAKMCCLGIYLEACGAHASDLLNRRYPSSVSAPLPNAAEWLIERLSQLVRGDTAEAVKLANANDNSHLSEVDRESTVKKLFERRGIKVTFVDSASPLPSDSPVKP